ncbi:MAG TPA: RodZ domain-containing protein [Candidatus Saccharimonadia bacterium]
MSLGPKASAKETTPSVGQILKNQRLKREFTLKDAEQATRIRGKYLLAIEADDYDNLPDNVYTRGFIQAYARYLGLATGKIINQYTEERGKQQRPAKAPRRLSVPRFILTPRVVVLFLSLILGFSAAAYLAYQLSALTAPPKLTITNPAKDQVVHGSLITVSGNVAGGADAYVNDSPILVDGRGNFTNVIALQDGVNTIKVSAKNRLGKTSTITRNILAHVPKTDPANSLPTAPFDGVAVKIQVQNVAATITIEVDGKKTFQGIMLPGTTQTFKGASTITVSTGDAGATSLSVTNAKVAAKDLGIIGKSGEAKSGFQFDKDTQFQ